MSKCRFIRTNRWCQPLPRGWFHSHALCLFFCLLFCLLPKAVGICLCTFMNNAAPLLGLMIFNLFDFHPYAYIFIYLCCHSITRGNEVSEDATDVSAGEVLCHFTWQLDFCYSQTGLKSLDLNSAMLWNQNYSTQGKYIQWGRSR